MEKEDNVEHIDVKVEEMASHLVANMVFYRTERIKSFRKRLSRNIDKMYDEKDMKRRDEICKDIRDNIDKIQEMIARNIDDVNNLEMTILTFTRKAREKDRFSIGYHQ